MSWNRNSIRKDLLAYQSINFLNEARKKKIYHMNERANLMMEALKNVVYVPSDERFMSIGEMEVTIARPLREAGATIEEIAEAERMAVGVPTKREAEEKIDFLQESIDYFEKNDVYIEKKYKEMKKRMNFIADNMDPESGDEFLSEIDFERMDSGLPELKSEREIDIIASVYQLREDNDFVGFEADEINIPEEDTFRDTGHYQVESRTTEARRAVDPLDDDEIAMINEAMEDRWVGYVDEQIFDELGFHESRRKKVEDYIFENIGFTETGEDMALAKIGLDLKEKYNSDPEKLSLVINDILGDIPDNGDDHHIKNFAWAFLSDKTLGKDVFVDAGETLQFSTSGKRKIKYNKNHKDILYKEKDHLNLFRKYLKLRNRLVNVGIEGVKSPSKTLIAKEGEKLSGIFVDRFLEISKTIPLKSISTREIFPTNDPKNGFNIRASSDGSNVRKKSEKMEGVWLFLKDAQMNNDLQPLGFTHSDMEKIDEIFVKSQESWKERLARGL